MKDLRLPALLLCGALLGAALSGCFAGTVRTPQPTPEAVPSVYSPEPEPTPSPEPALTGAAPAPVPVEPTAAMLGFTGLGAALFDGAYAAYFDQAYIAGFQDFPRVVLPQVSLLGSYEDGGVTYYVCNVGYGLHYYEPETGTFDETVGALVVPCRVGLTDNGDGTYTFRDGLLPPNGAGYGGVVREIFGPLDELYRIYTGEDNAPLEPVSTSLSADEMWALYREAADIE